MNFSRALCDLGWVRRRGLKVLVLLSFSIQRYWLDPIKPLTSDMETSSEKISGKWYDTGSESTSWLEVFAVVATGLLYFVSKCFKARSVFIITAVCFWSVFVYYCAHNDSSVMGEWGFRGKNFARCFLRATLLAVPILVAMAGFTASRGRLTFPAHAWILLALYPIWGIIQQFLVQALVVRNVARSTLALSPATIVLIGATVFAMAHLSNLRLLIATFGLGLVFVPLYLRYRNLWSLGLYHGWLGTFFYFWVLHRDPWSKLLAGIPFR
ncbi:MAG: CPBP family intramembrane glutamic endopeptidase [Syntrophobacteria bacterium]